MSNLIFLGLLLGMDSLAVGTGVGTAMPDRVRRWRLALSFALCDGLASLIGTAIGIDNLRTSLEWCEWLGPAAVAGYGVYVLFLTCRSQDLATTPLGTRWLVFGLPVCLSLDNLVAGAGTQAAHVPPVLLALTFGVLSGALALLGMWVGSAFAARVRFRAGWFGGTLLILVAGFLCLKDALT